MDIAIELFSPSVWTEAHTACHIQMPYWWMLSLLQYLYNGLEITCKLCSFPQY